MSLVELILTKINIILSYMSLKLEKLDTKNIIEIQSITEKLSQHPDLLSMFKLLIIIANKRLNDERIDSVVEDLMEDEDIFKMSPMPELSDHESDEDEEDEIEE